MLKQFSKYSFYLSPFAKYEGEGEGDGDRGGGGGGGGAPVALVGADGNMAENWHDSDLLEEGIRGHESLKTVTSIGNMAKQLVHANQSLGKNKVVLPGPNASDEEMGEFFKAIGRPETAADYSFKVPDEAKELINQENFDRAKGIAHKLGITQAQFEGYMQAELEAAGLAMQGAAEQAALDKQNSLDEVRERFGAAYDERMHIANRAISELCKDEEKQMMLLEKFGNDPDFIEFASTCGSKLVEHKALIAEMTVSTPTEALAKLAELRATPGFLGPDSNGDLLRDTDPAKKEFIMSEIERLTLEAHPEARPGA